MGLPLSNSTTYILSSITESNKRKQKKQIKFNYLNHLKMNTQEKLIEIWERDYIFSLPALIKERGFDYSKNTVQKDILITGINPSFNPQESINKHSNFSDILYKRVSNSRYWQPIIKMICADNIDLREETAYLDLFYFREKEQAFLKKSVLNTANGIRFIIDQLNLTQHVIEEIVKPKVIIVKNKESSAYWGKLAKDKGIIWMGYELEPLQNLVCGELFRITGLLDSAERIAPEITNTNLENTLVLFTEHIMQYTKREKRPTVQLIKSLLEMYNTKEKN